MLKKIYFNFIIFFFSIAFIQDISAQNFLDHTTGNLAVSVFEDGAIGFNDPATSGNGVVFMGNVNASFTGGFIMGNSTTKCSGHLGSFSINNEMVTSIPFSGFTSNANFNQIASCTYSDAGAPVANQLGLTVQQNSYSNTGDDFVFLDFIITNNTGTAVNGVYFGQFQDWDIGAAAFASNQGGYDQSRNLAYQYLPSGSPDPNYYGFVALSGMSGARVTTTGSGASIRDSSFAWMSTFLGEAITTNGDYRSWIGSGSYNLGSGQSVRVGFAVVAGTNLSDLQANTDASQNIWDNVILPVELTSFTASVNPLGHAVLTWVTATEINNRGFEIERREANDQFITIGFIAGFGTTSEEQTYSYVDQSVTPGTFVYRLKQIDFNGQFQYSDEVELEVTPPLTFGLDQNYPNPFNPNTNIKFSLAEAGNVKLAVYNTLGEEVAVLVNNYTEAGFYELNFDASNLPSGTYVYRLEAPGYVEAKKMILMK